MSRNKAVFTVRPVWVTNGCRSAVIAMLCSSLRMLQFRLGMDWLCRSTKQGCLSFAPARIRVGPNTCFSTAAAAAAAAACLLLLRVPLLLLLLLLLLASAAGASAAAAAAAALLVGPARCSIFYSNSSAKAIWR